MATGMGWNHWITAPGAAAAKGLEQFSIVGRYGLFASMTDGRASEADRACQELEVGDACQFEVLDTTYRGRCGERQQRRRCEPVGGRIELRIEGSLDGKSWAPYRLPYKPEAVAAAPKQIAPHMPRLDWLMWFAALHPAQRPPTGFSNFSSAYSKLARRSYSYSTPRLLAANVPVIYESKPWSTGLTQQRRGLLEPTPAGTLAATSKLRSESLTMKKIILSLFGIGVLVFVCRAGYQ